MGAGCQPGERIGVPPLKGVQAMRVAYLILAHDQPSHLRRLISVLSAEYAHCFVHIDQRSDISRFAGVADLPRVTVRSRMAVHHSGFSQPLAMIDLLREAWNRGAYDYFIFLSGVDYPIKDTAHIYTYLCQHEGTNFINFYPLVENADCVRNLTEYHFVDELSGLPGPIRLPLRLAVCTLNRVLPGRRFHDRLVPYRGSAYSCLYRDTVGYVLGFLDTPEGRALLDFFRRARCSDEMVFQTVILNSPWAAHCRFYDRDVRQNSRTMKNENKAYLHYIDWSPHRENPALLVESDYSHLEATDFLFARKFDEVRSGELLDAIDRRLLKREPRFTVEDVSPRVLGGRSRRPHWPLARP